MPPDPPGTVLTQATLSTKRCSEPGCDCDGILYFHAACHPASAVYAAYDKGVMHIICAICGRTIAHVAVAP